MKDLHAPFGDHLSASTTQCTCDDDFWQTADYQAEEQEIDSEFLDALCNGVITVGEGMKIVSQNYVSRTIMGDLRGQDCFRALENRDTPCENCPKLGKAHGDFETSVRCAGSACTLYEVRVYSADNSVDSGDVIEVYPNMIDRDALVKNMGMYGEEMLLLKSVVEDVRSAIMDDEPVPGTIF